MLVDSGANKLEKFRPSYWSLGQLYRWRHCSVLVRMATDIKQTTNFYFVNPGHGQLFSHTGGRSNMQKYIFSWCYSFISWKWVFRPEKLNSLHYVLRSLGLPWFGYVVLLRKTKFKTEVGVWQNNFWADLQTCKKPSFPFYQQSSSNPSFHEVFDFLNCMICTNTRKIVWTTPFLDSAWLLISMFS